MSKLFLLRYDTEADDPQSMAGFFEKAVEVHRKHDIPATFFCRGGAIDAREDQFRQFGDEVRGDPLFDLQDHSYTHIGLCYEAGSSVDDLRADYEKSWASHQRVFGKRPIGTSICGTSGRDGASLSGFDATDKSRAEFAMMADLGIRMINARMTGVDVSRQFCNFAALGHPEIMGFPSAHSDTSWMFQKPRDYPIPFIDAIIRQRAEADEHMPLMLHDWCAWTCAADAELSHVIHFADTARSCGYELATHAACLARESLWQA